MVVAPSLIPRRPGERVGDQGILEVGNIDVMHAVAEVYEEDVNKVLPGQSARVRVPTLNAELTGEVVRKDLVVGRKVLFNNPDKFDPRDYLKPARDAMKKVCAERMVQFGQAGNAGKIKCITLEQMAAKYAKA